MLVYLKTPKIGRAPRQPDLPIGGAFGVTWQEVVAKNIGLPVTFLNASTFGRVVDAMYTRLKVYEKMKMPRPEYAPLIAQDTGQSETIVSRFLIEIDKKRKTGKAVIAQAEKQKVVTIPGALTKIAIVAGLLGAGFLAFKFMK